MQASALFANGLQTYSIAVLISIPPNQRVMPSMTALAVEEAMPPSASLPAPAWHPMCDGGPGGAVQASRCADSAQEVPMPKGIYAAASAMVVETRNQEAVAHNLANLQTAGYRNETALRTSFAQLMAARGTGGDLSTEGGAGVLNAGSYYSFTQGTLETTGAPLDLALTGDGFYRVRTDQGRELLTRAAHFSTDPQGRLVTPEGWTVEGQGGVITIPPDAGHVMVGKTGTISVSSNVNGVSADT